MDPIGGEPETDQERTSSFVVFQLGSERYALDVGLVHEVIDVGTLTRMPGGPPALSGLCNLRGHVVPVWDLRVVFGLGDDGERGKAPCVLMVEAGSSIARAARLSGLLVDRVSDVLDIAPEQVEPAPTLGPGEGSVFVRGLIRHQDQFVLILDLDRVFEALTPPPSREVS
jgi:purine-binding chemotaxis protein CheW